MIDMQDREIVACTNLLMELQSKWARKTNNQKNLGEMSTEIKHKFFDLGFVVDVDLVPCIQINTVTGQSFPPDVVILSRVAGTEDRFDHDEKRFEVIRSKERGEKYDGLIESANKKARKAS